MKRTWTEEELVERWTLFPDEMALLANKSGHTRLGFAVMFRRYLALRSALSEAQGVKRFG